MEILSSRVGRRRERQRQRQELLLLWRALGLEVGGGRASAGALGPSLPEGPVVAGLFPRSVPLIGQGVTSTDFRGFGCLCFLLHRAAARAASCLAQGSSHSLMFVKLD